MPTSRSSGAGVRNGSFCVLVPFQRHALFLWCQFEMQYRNFKDIRRQAFLIGEDFSRFLIFKRIIQVRYEPLKNAMGESRILCSCKVRD